MNFELLTNKKICIVAYNICGGGGQVVLEAFLKKIKKSNSRAILILNNQIALAPELTKELEVIKISMGIIARFKLEYILPKISNEVDSILMFGNFPPMRNLNKPTFVFLQNLFLLESFKINSKYFGFAKPLIQKTWFHFFSKNFQSLIVQSNFMLKKAKTVKSLKNKQILIDNYFDADEILKLKTNKNVLTSQLNSICYIASDFEHKNHSLIINSLEIISKNIKNLEVVICLPNDGRFYPKYKEVCNHLGINLKNLAGKTRIEMLEEVCKVDLVVYPSLIESFGLPILEAILLDKPILLADLEYSKDFSSKAFGLFDPLCSLSFSTAVLVYFEKKQKDALTLSISNAGATSH